MAKKPRGVDSAPRSAKVAPERLAAEVPYRQERFIETMPLRVLALRLLSAHKGLELGAPTTFVDLPGIPNLEDAQIRQIVLDKLGVDAEELSSPELLNRLNEALTGARYYLTTHQGFGESIVPSITLNSADDVVNLVKSTTLFSGEKSKGAHQPEQVAMNCAFVSTAFAYYELGKEGVQTLRAQTEYVVNFFKGKLTGAPAGRRPQLFFDKPKTKTGAADEETGGIPISIAGMPETTAYRTARGKRTRRAAGKFLRDPFANEQQALKDAIGIRIELPKKQVGGAMVQIAPYLVRYLGAKDIEIEDRNMLTEQEFDDLRTQLGGTLMTDFSLERSGDGVGYRVLKISADIQVPQDPSDPDPHALKTYRRMELQIVDVGNRNEVGFKNHGVYELGQTVEESTRLFGSISEVRLRRLAAKVAEKGGPDTDAIIEELERSGQIFKLPGTQRKYASVSQWRRWLAIQDDQGNTLIPEKIRKSIESRLPPVEETSDEQTDENF